MSENRFITILIILVFILSGFIGWHLLSPEGGDKEISIKNPASILSSTNENTPSKEAKMISSRDSVSIVIANDKNRVDYYESTTGIAFEVGINGGSEKALSSGRLPNFLSTTWSPNKKEVISEFAAPANSKIYTYYNYITRKSSKLPPDMQSLAFSPSGDRIVYFKKEAAELFGLFVSAPDGSNPKRIMSTRISRGEVYWPLKESVALKSTDDDQHSSLFLVSLDGKITKIVSDKNPLSIKWQPEGKSVLVSYTTDDGGVLGVVEPATGKERSIPIDVDARECAWASFESVVCRINADLTTTLRSSGLHDINIKSGEITPIEGGRAAINGVKEIIVDPSGSYVLFIRREDGKLFSLKR